MDFSDDEGKKKLNVTLNLTDVETAETVYTKHVNMSQAIGWQFLSV